MKALNHGYVVTVVKLDRLVRFEPRPLQNIHPRRSALAFVEAQSQN
jgi:hypothetical protein